MFAELAAWVCKTVREWCSRSIVGASLAAAYSRKAWVLSII